MKVLCIGNGAMVHRDGRLWSHRYMGDFLTEIGSLVGEFCFCAWLDPKDNPSAQAALEDIPNLRALSLPRLEGPLYRKLVNGMRSMRMLHREITHADFVYLFWPGRLSSIAARMCRLLRKPYGIYLRGERVESDGTFASAFTNARFALTTGKLLETMAKKYCHDVEEVTPMTSLRVEHVVGPRPVRPSSSPWQLLYMGRLEERKGVGDLLASLAFLEEWRLPFVLTMVGHQYDTEMLAQLPSSIKQNVRLIGAVSEFDDLIPFYKSADAFVFPSHDEGFPRVLYEAMAFGVPIITTFVGSIPFVMRDRSNCLRIEVRNPRDIAEKIRELLTDPELQQRIAAGGHATIMTLFKKWQRSHPVQIAERLRGLNMQAS